MPDPKLPLNGTILLMAAALVGACEQTAGIAPTTGPMFSDVGNAASLPQFNDMLIPAGAKIYVERTLILGENPWYGQLALGVTGDLPALFEQYRRDMQSLGWQEITSIRAAVSVITFMREDRVATVQIQAARLRGSEVTITVSPRGGVGSTSGRGGSPGRPAPVQRQ